MSSLKDTVHLYANQYVGCQSRKGNIDHFFKHENFDYPSSLSDHCKMRKAVNKSEIRRYLSYFELFELPSTDDKSKVVN